MKIIDIKTSDILKKKPSCRTLKSVLHYRFLQIFIRTMTHRICDEEINKVVHPANVSSLVRVLFFKNLTEPGKQRKVFSLTGLFFDTVTFYSHLQLHTFN